MGSSLFSFIQSSFLTEAQCVMEGGTRITTGGREQLPGAGRRARPCCAGARRCYSCPGCSSTPPSTLRSPAHPSYTPANRVRLYLVLCSAPSVPQPVVQSRRRLLLGPSPG